MTESGPQITRFAPSPNGFLHLGHAYAAIVAFDRARASGGRFHLRIEDIDRSRSRPDFEDAIKDDLRWLGLDWEEPVRRQSERLGVYGEALAHIQAMGLLYPCFCTRREIIAEIERSANAPHGPEGPLYPGTCRRLDEGTRRRRLAEGRPYALRLDTGAAMERVGPLTWRDQSAGLQVAAPERLGDVVLARKEVPTSYHLAVVVDDAAQGITLVTRGRDLFEATHMHRLLQALLQLPIPTYFHHDLVVDETGKRLSKRDKSLSLQTLRESGLSPMEIRRLAEAKIAGSFI